MAPEEKDARICQKCGNPLLPDSKFCHKCGSPITSKKNEIKPPGSEERSKGKEELELQPLYNCYSNVNNFRYRGIYYDNLKINWFVTGRKKQQVPFEQAILKYSQLSTAARAHPENYILERFTQMETELLKGYLSSVQKISAVAEEIELPVSANKKGYHAIPASPGTDFIALYKKQSYNLPFNVEGIFNIKMADEKIMGDDKETVISRFSIEDLKKHS